MYHVVNTVTRNILSYPDGGAIWFVSKAVAQNRADVAKHLTGIDHAIWSLADVEVKSFGRETCPTKIAKHHKA